MKALLGLIALALAATPAAAQFFYSSPMQPLGAQHPQLYAGPMTNMAAQPAFGWRSPGYYPYAPVGPYYNPYTFGYTTPFGTGLTTSIDYAYAKPADVFVHEPFAYAAFAAPPREPVTPLAPGTALVTLELPADATVVFQGQATKQAGTRRLFVTPALSGPGTYDVKVSWPAGNKTEEQALVIDVNPGDRRVVTVFSASR